MPGSLFEVINKNPVVVKIRVEASPGLLAVSRNGERLHGEIRQQNWGKGQDILQIQGRFTQRHHRTDELGIVYPAAPYLLQHSLQHLLLPPRPSGVAAQHTDPAVGHGLVSIEVRHSGLFLDKILRYNLCPGVILKRQIQVRIDLPGFLRRDLQIHAVHRFGSPLPRFRN